MRTNKKGTTIIELLVSVVIISLVLTFILQLYIRIRGTYLNNSIQVKYELSKSIITDAAMHDFINYHFHSFEPYENKIVFGFKKNENDPDTAIIKKTLTVDDKGTYYLIKYSGGSDTSITRKYEKNDVTIGKLNENMTSILKNSKTEIHVFKIPIKSKENIDYSINLYCPTNLD